MHQQKGFTLVELLIVLAIIAIIAAFAIPNLLQSKLAANESSAIANVRSLVTAEFVYARTSVGNVYGSLADLQASPGLIDNVLGSGTKDGYNYVMTGAGTSTNFTITATPITYGVTGRRGFYSDATSVVRYTTDGSAPTAASSALGK